MRRLRRGYQKHIKEQEKRRNKFRKSTIAAGAAAAITLGSGLSINRVLAAYTPDPHELPVSQDADADLLANKEEQAIGYRLFKPDQNRNEIPDGAELARRCSAIIDELPDANEAAPGETYKWHAAMYGSETCDICSDAVNMGPAGVVNPTLAISVDCSLLAQHYMAHGSFNYAGDVYGEGRIDVAALLYALEVRYPCDPNDHQLPVDPNDLDGDLLTDSEELETGLNLYEKDQNQDLTPDGIGLAKRCVAVIDQLPWDYEAAEGETYKWHDVEYGVETCDICGEAVNMGLAGIENPTLAISVDCSLLAQHYMSHGSFNYAGDVYGEGRIDVTALVKALGLPTECGDIGTMYLPGDLNEDCKIDLKDIAELADDWLESTEP